MVLVLDKNSVFFLPQLLRLEEQDTYSFADFALLEEYERVNHVQDIYDALKDIQHEGIDPDDLTRYRLLSYLSCCRLE